MFREVVLNRSCLSVGLLLVCISLFSGKLLASDSKIDKVIKNDIFQSHILAEARARFIRVHHYKITISDDLESAHINACFSGKAPEYLAVDYRRSTKNIVSFPKSEAGYVEIVGRYWKTKYLEENACINYKASISEHLVKKNKLMSGPLNYQRENTWLWLPEKLSEDESVIAEFDLPENVNLSVPWKSLDKPNQFQISRAPIDWGFTLVVGHFEQRSVELLKGAELELNFLGNIQQIDALSQWVTHVADSLKNYLGEFPAPKVQVVLLENSRFARGPVPWGEVNRGGGFGIRFVVNSGQNIDEFYSDWTASHEFAHLLMPKLRYEDSWMSEGLASYLQYLLMARGEQINQQEAWQELYEGLRRGSKGTESLNGETLKETMHNRRKTGWRSGRTMRIYWSGAAYFLLADWKLRQKSQGTIGLAEVLKKFNLCCSESPKLWTGKEFALKLDSLSSSQIFSKLYKEVINSEEFPDYLPALEGLGITLSEEKVVLKMGEAALWRKQIDSE